MKRMALFLSIFLFSSTLLGCSGGGSETSQTPKVELMVSAAASLTDALTDIKRTYESRQEGVTLTFNFGSSGKLATQIEQGAPADVFLSASEKDMDGLEAKGLIVEHSRVDFTSNSLVLISAKESTLGIPSFPEINPRSIQHLAIGEPEAVPVGWYTKEVFEHLGLWEPLQDKLVLGSDVRQVLTHVEMGNADLGVVYSSDAAISDKVKVLAEANGEWHTPIVYPGAIIRESEHQQAAQAFLDYLISDDGEELLRKCGFQ
ncbi:molybdate ABC transporter substrate-binding protein [Sporosarcina sp. 179-K 3D1 HS]|uniref:molybdate ABC transporter substrate-binding protein n=1 Tax=Sporosarcina sp. 179-K 3D1 HS TaxID=3232169 RepID=UPI00399FFF17